MKPDRDYIYERDLLIPKAERRANRLHGKVKRTDIEKSADWSKTFHRTMNRLAKERLYEHPQPTSPTCISIDSPEESASAGEIIHYVPDRQPPCESAANAPCG